MAAAAQWRWQCGGGGSVAAAALPRRQHGSGDGSAKNAAGSTAPAQKLRKGPLPPRQQRGRSLGGGGGRLGDSLALAAV